MKSQFVIGAFLVGALTASSVSVLAGGGRSQSSGKWVTASVDLGSIRSQIYKDVPMSAAPEQIRAADDKATAEAQEKIEALTEKGYEPFAATVYKSNIYSNERVWFFRKKQ